MEEKTRINAEKKIIKAIGVLKAAKMYLFGSMAS
jgi:hypothetical protein